MAGHFDLVPWSFLSPSRQTDPQQDEITPIDPQPAKMKFIFTGFKQEGGFRVFSYDGITDARERLRFSVRIDLALSRQHGIRLQELPLLGVTLLERRTGDEHELTFTEEAMARCVEEAAAAQQAEDAKNAPKRRVKAEPVVEEDPYASAPMPNPWRTW